MHSGRKLTLFFISFLTVVSSPLAHAAGSFNLTTSPLPVLLSGKPGTSLTASLRVENSGVSAQRLQVSLYKFKADGTSGQPQIYKPSASDASASWVSFSPGTFMAYPGVWNSVKMTINLPASAAFGYYYAAVFSPAGQLPAGSAGNTNKLKGATAILVLVDAQAKGEKRQLSLASFTADKKVFEYLPVNFSIKIANPGNIHGIPSGNIFIMRGSKVIDTIDINPNQGNILPGSARTFAPSWSDGFPVFSPKRVNGQIVTDKHGQPFLKLDWNFAHANKLRFGKYTAHLVMSYDNGSRDVPIESTLTFWVVPWKLIFAFIALVIGLYFLHRWSVRRAVRKHQAKARAPADKKESDR